MTTPTSTSPLAPNHHRDHAGFSGVAGLLAGLTMTVGRDSDARLAIELTALTAADRVVDIGCGPGTAARAAARLGATVVGVDPAPVMLRLARGLTRGAGRISYVDGTAEALALPDASATVVLSLASVHHWLDLAAGLAEARRVLAPGGRFLAIERHTRPGATGHASHGWTDEQAAQFADDCRTAGFADVSVTRHKTAKRRVLAVVARKP